MYVYFHLLGTERENEKEQAPFSWFTPQMFSIVGAGSEPKSETVNALWVSNMGDRNSVIGAVLLPSRVCYGKKLELGAGAENQTQGLQYVTWNSNN